MHTWSFWVLHGRCSPEGACSYIENDLDVVGIMFENFQRLWNIDLRARRRVQAATALIAFGYAVLNSVALRRPEEQVTWETLGLICFLTLVFSALYCFRPKHWKIPTIRFSEIFRDRGMFELVLASTAILLSISFADHIPGLGTFLLSFRTVQAAHNPTDIASIARANNALDTAKRTSIQIPPDVIEKTGKSFIKAGSNDPAAWRTALRFVEYRSYLNLTLQVAPPSPNARNTTTQYITVGAPGFPGPTFSIAGLIPKDQAARFNRIGESVTSDTGFGNQ
jgi:hypothetical protein